MIDEINLEELKSFASTGEEPLSYEMQSILDFINMMLGSYMRVREIHWNTRNHSMHILCDEVMDALIDYTDRIAEGIMGLDNKRFGFNVLEPNIPKSYNLEEICNVLQHKSRTLEETLSSPLYSGVTNITNDFRETFNKFNYLRTLS